MHTLRSLLARNKPRSQQQRRDIHITESASNHILSERGVPVAEDENLKSRDYFLEVTIDRSTCMPCIITSYAIGGESAVNHAKTHILGLDKRIDAPTFSSIATELKCPKESFASLTTILTALIDVFFSKEAFSLVVRLSRNTEGRISVARSTFEFDDAAFRSSGRQEDLQALRDVANERPEEKNAEKDGIVYMRSAHE